MNIFAAKAQITQLPL